MEIKKGNTTTSKMEAWLNEGVNINYIYKNGESLLQAASETGNIDLVKYLLDKGAQIDNQNSKGESSLYIASEKSHIEVVKMLLKYKAQVDLQGEDGWSSLMVASQNGHVDVEKMLLENKAQVDLQNNNGWTSLMVASNNGHVDVVKMLLKYKAQVDLQGEDGWSSLMFASLNGHVDVVKMLLKYKAQVDLQGEDGWSSLMFASQNGHVDVVKMLLENQAQVDLQKNDGESSLMIASENGHVDVIKLLLENRAQGDVQEEDRWSSVMAASQNGHVDVVNILLGNKAQVSSQNNKCECTMMNQSAEPKRGNRVMFKVELFSTHTNNKESQSITFEGNPLVTIATIKEKVEENFNIPVCVLSLSYDSCPLNDDASFEAMRIRSGDTLHITYPTKGNCKEIKAIVTWFEQVRDFLLTEDPTISNTRFSLEFNDLLTYGIDQQLMENVAFKYFDSQQEHVNKLYFVSCGGLKIVMDVYAALLRHPWNDGLTVLKYVQCRILDILWSFSWAETFELCRRIVSHNGLELCIQSLLREKVIAGEYIADKNNSENQRNRHTSSRMLVENIEGALRLLSK